MESVKKNIEAMLARQLASRQMSDADIGTLADRVLEIKGVPQKIDATEVGIVVDADVSPADIEDLIKFVLKPDKFGQVEFVQVFPQGVVAPDSYVLRVSLR